MACLGPLETRAKVTPACFKPETRGDYGASHLIFTAALAVVEAQLVTPFMRPIGKCIWVASGI